VTYVYEFFAILSQHWTSMTFDILTRSTVPLLIFCCYALLLFTAKLSGFYTCMLPLYGAFAFTYVSSVDKTSCSMTKCLGPDTKNNHSIWLSSRLTVLKVA